MSKKNTLLAIFQQGEYDHARLKKWYADHRTNLPALEPEQWTPKLKLLNALSLVFFFLPTVTSLGIALVLITPFEMMLRQTLYTQASLKLWWYKWKGLQVVAIAGSYGKTSTKQILFHALSQEKSVLYTPESINTLLGIAQVIRKDLKPHHQVFIVEFGEYHPEDIPNLTRFVKPHFGILTPIGRQHLEIIGGFEALVKTFTSYIAFFQKKPATLLVAEQNKQYFPTLKLQYYGAAPESHWRVFNTRVTRAGTEYEVLDRVHNVTYQSFTPLFGEHQAINALTVFWLATLLHLPIDNVNRRLRTTPYITRRHQPTFAEHNVLILDNSYNTNPESAQESLRLLNQLEPTRRLLITLGFTELGTESDKIHYEFGQLLAKHVDYIGLIQAPWTQKIVDGFLAAGGSKDHLQVGASQEEAFAKIQAAVIPGSVVLFEGGFREVYV